MGREGFPGAGTWVPDRLSVSAIRSNAKQSRGCELLQEATKCGDGDGPESAALMVVGGATRRQGGPRGRVLRRPSRWQVTACEPWLLAELEVVRPRVVGVLGATAGQAVFGPSFRVGESRGRRLGWPGDRAPLRARARGCPSSRR